MKIRLKLVMATMVALMVLIILVYPLVTVFMFRTFENLEREKALEDVRLVLDEIEFLIREIDTSNNILSSSDEAYDFVRGTDRTSLGKKLIPETYQTHQANILVIATTSGNILFNGSYDLVREMNMEFPQELRDHIVEDRMIWDMNDKRDHLSGLISYGTRVLMVSSRPILRSDNEGDVLGVMMMGRFFNKDTLISLHTKSNMVLDYHVLSEEYLPGDYKGVNKDTINIKTLSDDRIAGFAVLKDISGEDILVLKVTMARSITRSGFRSIIYYFLLTALLMVAGVLTFGFLAETMVINRITKLSEDVNRVKGEGSERVRLTGKDEVRSLGDSINTMLDSIENKQRELTQSEEKYRTLISCSPTGIAITKDGVIEYINGTALKILRMSDEKMALGRRVSEFYFGGNSAAADVITQSMAKNDRLERPVEVPVMRTDGSRVFLEVMGTRIMLGSSMAEMWLFTDVTELKEKRQELEEREMKYRSLFDLSSDAIFLAKDGLLVDCNPAALGLFGANRADLIGRSPMELSPPQQSDGRSSENGSLEIVERLRRGEEFSFEWDHLTMKGNMIHTESSVKPIRLGGQDYVLSIVRDITARKVQEKRLIEERNRAALYLDLLTHDMGNIHQGIGTTLDLTLMTLDDRKRTLTNIERSRDLTAKAIRLVSYVRLMARKDEARTEPLDLIPIVQTAMRRTLGSFREREMDLRLDVEMSEAGVMTAPIIEEAIFNVLHNAVKVQRADAAAVVEISIAMGDNDVELRIADRGPGIKDEMKPIMFDRFKAGGSLRFIGLGLSLVRNLVDRYAKDVWIEDRVQGDPSLGAVFVISFKRANVKNGDANGEHENI